MTGDRGLMTNLRSYSYSEMMEEDVDDEDDVDGVDDVDDVQCR